MKYLLSLAVLLILLANNLYSQVNKYKNDLPAEIITANRVRFYAGYNHQHLKFLDKAFSFQGIEIDFVFFNNLIAGAYGASFVSNLQVELSNQTTYYVLSQAGIVTGYTYQKPKLIHPGILTTIGCLSAVGNDTEIPIFNVQNSKIKTGGLVIAPQVFAEIAVLKWIKIRTGLGYNFYRLAEQSVIKNTDIQDFAFTFGIFFGIF